MAQCRYCGSALSKDPAKITCPACKQPNLPGAGFSTKPETVLMSEVKKLPVKEKRYDVGIFNEIFGGGFAKTCEVIIGGPPGAGKTTMFLMLCEMILLQIEEKVDEDGKSTGKKTSEVLYIANEQIEQELEDYGERLGLTQKHRIRIYDAMGGLQRPLADIMSEFKPKLLILDSLTKCIGEDVALGVRIVENIKELTCAYKCPSLIVNQVNKEGEHAGVMKVPHAADLILSLDLDEKTGQRLLFSTKNRMGPAPLELYLRMLPVESQRPGWLVPWQTEETDEGEETDE
jgi:DNA repair protein RadA/Sms